MSIDIPTLTELVAVANRGALSLSLGNYPDAHATLTTALHMIKQVDEVVRTRVATEAVEETRNEDFILSFRCSNQHPQKSNDENDFFLKQEPFWFELKGKHSSKDWTTEAYNNTKLGIIFNLALTYHLWGIPQMTKTERCQTDLRKNTDEHDLKRIEPNRLAKATKLYLRLLDVVTRKDCNSALEHHSPTHNSLYCALVTLNNLGHLYQVVGRTSRSENAFALVVTSLSSQMDHAPQEHGHDVYRPLRESALYGLLSRYRYAAGAA